MQATASAVRSGSGAGSSSSARFEQRIAFELRFHIGGEVEIGELQQLDGLHQLRRHHQRVALAELESLAQSHAGCLNWSDSCFLIDVQQVDACVVNRIRTGLKG